MAMMPNREPLVPGTQVEVRTRHLSNWAASFEVSRVDGDQFRVRHRSDGVVLPVEVAFNDVRHTAGQAERR